MDPPYRLFNLGKVLKSIASTIGLVVDAGEVIVGHSRHLELLPEYGSLYLISNRRYGDNVVEFFRQGDRAWLPPFTPEPLIQ
jgi:16S rRNA G966 N2-methylase RsmD